MSPHGFLAASPGWLARWPNDLREMQRSLGSGLQPFGADLGAVEVTETCWDSESEKLEMAIDVQRSEFVDLDEQTDTAFNDDGGKMMEN